MKCVVIGGQGVEVFLSDLNLCVFCVWFEDDVDLELFGFGQVVFVEFEVQFVVVFVLGRLKVFDLFEDEVFGFVFWIVFGDVVVYFELKFEYVELVGVGVKVWVVELLDVDFFGEYLKGVCGFDCDCCCYFDWFDYGWWFWFLVCFLKDLS